MCLLLVTKSVKVLMHNDRENVKKLKIDSTLLLSNMRSLRLFYTLTLRSRKSILINTLSDS